MAGLWLEDFPMALLWNTVVGRFKETGHSVEKWRAPSWSWASIEGALDCIGNRILPSKRLTDERTPKTNIPLLFFLSKK